MSILSITQSIEKSLASYLPTTLAAVVAVEAAAHQLPGETKLQTVVNVVLATTNVAQGMPVPPVAAIAGLVNLLVGLLNMTGVFNHGATKPTLPVVAIPAAVVVSAVRAQPIVAAPTAPVHAAAPVAHAAAPPVKPVVHAATPPPAALPHVG